MSNVDFSLILASTVHDTKNSLSLLLQSLDELVHEAEQLMPEQIQRFSVIQYEASRVNNDLIQMLGLFKLAQNQLPLNISYYPLSDFLEDQMLRYSTLLDTRGIRYRLSCDEALAGYFDADLVASVLNNVITNTIRYTRDAIRLRAWQQDGLLMIEVADNGQGYPEAMLENEGSYQAGISLNSGSTGLGLYFAQQIAALHEKDGVHGRISLRNGGELGGGLFTLSLP